MAFELSRVDRLTRTYDLADVLKGAVPTGITGVELALLPPRGAPTAATVWFAATYAAGVVSVLLAGPDADSSGALVVSASADLWMKITDSPEVDAVKVERVSVLGGGAVLAAPVGVPVVSVNGKTGSAVALTAADVGAATPADLATKVNSSTYTAGLAALSGTYVPFQTLALNPDMLITGTVTRDGNGAATSAPVTWPDGSPGTYTATTVSTAFPGAVDAYTITYGSPVIRTYTQPAVTRDSAGAVTQRPALVVS